jgi:VCBS repeat-containing protein
MVLRHMGDRCTSLRRTLPGDLNGDCRVNGRDLQYALKRIGKTRANRTPVATPDAVTTREDEAMAVSVLANDADPDGHTVQLVSAAQGTLGTTVAEPDGRITYTPSPNVHGTDVFAYVVTDGRGGTASASVTVTIEPVNDPPVVSATATPAAGPAPLDVQLTAEATDIDGDVLSYAWSMGDGAVAAGPTPTHTYGSAGDFVARVTVSDGLAESEADVVVSVASRGRPTAYVVETMAGTGVPSEHGEGGPAVAAGLWDPRQVAVTSDGALLILDAARLLRVDSAGILTRVRSFVDQDPGRALAVGPLDDVYYTESTVVGACSEGGWYSQIVVRRLAATLPDPIVASWSDVGAGCASAAGLAVDASGDFYLGAGATVVKLAPGASSPSWQVVVPGNVYSLGSTPQGGVLVGSFDGVTAIASDGSTLVVAGNGTHGSDGDGGPALAAMVGAVSAITAWPHGAVSFLQYDFLSGMPRIREIAPDATITTIGGGLLGYNGDGHAALSTAFNFFLSAGIARAPDGGLYVADVGNHRVRRLVPVIP